MSGKRRGIHIDDQSWAWAKELGEGNASEGIRDALFQAVKRKRRMESGLDYWDENLPEKQIGVAKGKFTMPDEDD